MGKWILALLLTNLVMAAVESDLVDDPHASDLVPSIIKSERWDDRNVTIAKEAALKILTRASITTLNDKMHKLYDTMEYSLSRVAFVVPPEGMDLEHCVQTPEQKEKGIGVLAFVNTRNRGVINICAKTSDAKNTKFVAQVIVHETAHTVGIDNECGATFAEINAMRESGAGLAMKNAYMKDCNLE